MSENAGQKTEDKELRQLRAEYWTKRLDHTLTHTQTSSRLIYLIDGAVLALVYFSIQTLGATRPVILVASLPTFLLVALNGLHARLIGIQHSWYSGIDATLRGLLKVDPVQHAERFPVLGSTHGVYRSMHAVMATFLLFAAVAMLLYGLGYFPDLQVPKRKEGG